jgi:hypothetical protein
MYALFGIRADSESGKFISKTGKFRCPNLTPDGNAGGGSGFTLRVAETAS